MSHLEKVETEMSRGRFGRALRLLAEAGVQQRSQRRSSYRVLTAQILQLMGNNEKAELLARTGLRSTDRTRATDARCLNVLAVAAFEHGQFKRSLGFFQRARSAASDAHDVEQTCRILLDLVAHFADSLPAEAAAAAMDACASAVSRLGHPHVDARYHIIFAGLQAKRGSHGQAAAHLRAAELSLSARPNAWLEGLLALSASTIRALNADLGGGLSLARRALDRSRVSGHARTKAGAFANLAYLTLWDGEIDAAEAHCRDGLALAADMLDVRIALLDTLAQVELARGRWSECGALLSRIDGELPCGDGFRPSWYELASVVTHARLQLQQKNWASGLSICRNGMAISDERGDHLHGISLRVLGADALIELRRPDEASDWIIQAARQAEDAPIAVYAEVERGRAALVARTAGPAAARRRFERALRLLDAEGGIAVRMDAAGSYLRTMRPVNEELRRRLRARPHDLGPLVAATLPGTETGRKPAGPHAPNRHPAGLAQAAPLIHLARNTDLLARETFVLLRESGCAESLAVIEKDGGRVTRVPAHEGWTADQAARASRAAAGVVAIPTGASKGRDVSVVAAPRDGVQSRTLVHDVKLVVEKARILASLHERERARGSGWPPNLAPVRDDGVFACDSMTRLVALARRVAAGDEAVLITGETGTGKEMIARIIHRHSARANRDFVPFNCTGVPREMVESHLFGHRRGAFTGARDDSQGVIRAASGGTLLLDEVGELELSLQPKLLRFLDRQEVHPLGEPRPVSVSVRVIAATNADIDRLVQAGQFREDLYYRLNIIRLDVPPLRERREEIPPLVHHFLRQFGAARGRPNLTMTDDALECLILYEWPGNVRRLANEVRRAVALADGDGPIDRELLSPEVAGAAGAASEASPGATDDREVRIRTDQPLADAVVQVERAMIRRALDAAGGNVAAAARMLGVSRKGLAFKRRRLETG